MYISYDTIFFFFWSSPLLLIFFFPIRTPTVTCTGHWIQLRRETWSKHGSNFFITPCEIWREWWVKKKEQSRLVPWSDNRNERNLYVHKTQGNKKRHHCKTAAAKARKKEKRKWGAAEQYTIKKGEKKVCAMTCEIQKYVCRTQREMWESTISRASGDQENTRKRKKKRKKKESKRTNKTHKRIRKEQREHSGASRESEKKNKVRKQHVRLGEPRDKVKQSGKVNKRPKWLDGLWCRKEALTCKNQVIKAMKQVQITNKKKRCSLEVIVTAPVLTARWHDDSGTEWACAQE